MAASKGGFDALRLDRTFDLNNIEEILELESLIHEVMDGINRQPDFLRHTEMDIFLGLITDREIWAHAVAWRPEFRITTSQVPREGTTLAKEAGSVGYLQRGLKQRKLLEDDESEWDCEDKHTFYRTLDKMRYLVQATKGTTTSAKQDKIAEHLAAITTLLGAAAEGEPLETSGQNIAGQPGDTFSTPPITVSPLQLEAVGEAEE